MRHPVTLPHEPATAIVSIGRREVEYRLRRSSRSRGMRVTIDARDRLVV